MLRFIFALFNYSTLLLFGVFISAAILDITFNRKNTFILTCFCTVIFALQIVCYIKFGDMTSELYPLITHAPLTLLYYLLFKRRLLSCIFAVTSSYLCCALTEWFGILVLYVIGVQWVAYGIRAALNLGFGFLIVRYFASSIAVILRKPAKTVVIFSILPVSYFLFDYIATVYTNLLYRGSEAVINFLPLVLCVSYLIFSAIYFREYEEKCEVERHNQLMEMQRSQSEKEIELIKRSEYAVSLLRHDMWHFLNNIIAYIENNDTDKAKAYISEIIASADKTTMQKYCDNEIVNMILSSYESIMNENGIRFEHTIQIPAKLPISDVDLTSILSNGLENAIHAVSIMDEEKRNITLHLRMKDEKLLLSIKNPYANKIKMVDDMPQSTEPGHGLGTHSIKYITEKLNGNCQFSFENEQFTLRVVL